MERGGRERGMSVVQRAFGEGSGAYIQYVIVSVLRSLLITTLKKSAQPSDRRRSAYKSHSRTISLVLHVGHISMREGATHLVAKNLKLIRHRHYLCTYSQFRFVTLALSKEYANNSRRKLYTRISGESITP